MDYLARVSGWATKQMFSCFFFVGCPLSHDPDAKDINATHTNTGWVPIRINYGGDSRRILAANHTLQPSLLEVPTYILYFILFLFWCIVGGV